MSSDRKHLPRRDVVTGMGYGIAGAALSGSAASAQSNGSVAAPMVSPDNKYPKRPYPDQSQPWPGLASKMNPQPDHGEKSYEG